MGIFALGLAFDASQTVRPASVTLRGHQLHDLCSHDKIGVLIDEYDAKHFWGQDCEDLCAKSLTLDWATSCSICLRAAASSYRLS